MLRRRGLAGGGDRGAGGPPRGGGGTDGEQHPQAERATVAVPAWVLAGGPGAAFLSTNSAPRVAQQENVRGVRSLPRRQAVAARGLRAPC